MLSPLTTVPLQPCDLRVANPSSTREKETGKTREWCRSLNRRRCGCSEPTEPTKGSCLEYPPPEEHKLHRNGFRPSLSMYGYGDVGDGNGDCNGALLYNGLGLVGTHV
ncbi:hypothetical protein RIF29_40816 [Crotalaria pallida]|uniref:Uncharacterized protein n=1 Tax=Crotalaria pallida TaxID=3830 RepID=A0AAN9EA43_CROPI